jgi:hypothetical protein
MLLYLYPFITAFFRHGWKASPVRLLSRQAFKPSGFAFWHHSFIGLQYKDEWHVPDTIMIEEESKNKTQF